MLSYLSGEYRWLSLLTSLICFISYFYQTKHVKLGYGAGTIWPKGLISPRKATNVEKQNLVKINYGVLVSGIAFLIYTLLPLLEPFIYEH